MATYVRRPDGLALLEGVPAPLALTDAQLARMGHTPAPPLTRPPAALPSRLRGLPPGALAQAGGAGGMGDVGPGNVPDVPPAPAGAGGAPPAAPRAWDPSQGGAPPASFNVTPNAGTGTQSSVPNEKPDTQMSPTNTDGTPRSGVAGERDDLPDAPRQRAAAPAFPGGSPVRRIPGGIQLAGYRHREGLPMSDADMTDAVGLKRTELEAGERKYAADLKAEAKATEAEANELAFQHARLAGEREKRKRIDDGLREAEAKWQQREQALNDIPPAKMSGFWEDKGIAGALGAAMTLVANGLLAARQGRGGNDGFTQIRDIQNSWVAEKRDQYERAADAATRARSRYGQLLELYGTPEQAEKALQAEAAVVTGKQIENFARMNTIPGKVAALQALQAQNGQEVIKLRNELLAARRGEIEKTFVNKPDQYVGGPAKLKDDSRKRLFRLRDGSYVFHRDAGAADKDQDNYTASAKAAAAAARLRRLRNQPGAKTDPELRGQIEGAAASLFLALKKKEALGTLDKGSLEFRDEWIGKPLDLIDFGGADAKLAEIERGAEDTVHDIEFYKLNQDEAGTVPLHDAEPEGVEER